MQNYYSRIHDLRKELTAEIVGYLKKLKHNFILIPDREIYEDGTWVVSIDDDGEASDCRVTEIGLYNEKEFCVEAEDNYGNTSTLYSSVDIGCTHVEWLASMLDMLKVFIDGDHWRVCDECGKVIDEGFVVNQGEKHYCGKTCLHKHYDEETWAKMCHARYVNPSAEEDDTGGNDLNYWTTFYQQ